MSKPIRPSKSQNLPPQIPRTQKHNSRSSAKRVLSPTPNIDVSLSQQQTIAITELSLVLPVPPSINHQYATVNGRRILSSKGRQYKTGVGQEVLHALLTVPDRATLLDNLQTHALSLSICFYFTTALRRDIDGGLKIAQDAICHALGINDNRIIEIHLYKSIDATAPRMECTLTSLLTEPRPAAKSTQTRIGLRQAKPRRRGHSHRL